MTIGYSAGSSDLQVICGEIRDETVSILVYAESLQYAGVSILAAGIHPIYACAMALMINACHLECY